MSVVILNTCESIGLYQGHVQKWAYDINYEYSYNIYPEIMKKIVEMIRHKVDGFNSEVFAEVIMVKHEYGLKDNWFIDPEYVYSPFDVVVPNADSILYHCMETLADVDILFMAYDEAIYSDCFYTNADKIRKEKKRWRKRTRIVLNKIKKLRKQMQVHSI